MDEAVKMNPYEALILFPQSQTSDLSSAVKFIEESVSRAGAEMVALSKWAERTLAYSIKKQKRGVYLLAYFNAPGPALARIERDCNLSDMVLRFMITRADHLSVEQMQAMDDRRNLGLESSLRAEKPEEQAVAAVESAVESE